MSLNTIEKVGSFSGPVETYLDDGERLMDIKFPFSISERVSKLTLSHHGRIRPDVMLGTKATPNWP